MATPNPRPTVTRQLASTPGVMTTLNTRQQQDGEQREGRGQDLRGRTMDTNYPGRYTGNTQRPTLPEAPPVRGSALPAHKKVPYRQEVPAEDFDTPTRCTSPVPFKTHAPQLNLQIPKQPPRHPVMATISGPMKILKRHTSPYPTPASSPNVETLSPGLSPPARSNTYPVGKDFEGVEQKYTDRMKSLLECNLKVFDPSQDQSKEPLKEARLEDNPVPDFFVAPVYPEATTQFNASMSGNLPDENAMMNPEYITMGSMEDLENEMTGFLPDATYSEYMPDPEEPMQEPRTGVVVTVDSPTEVGENKDLPHAITTTNGFLNTPVKVHPISDSGIESMTGSPGRRSSFTDGNTEPKNSVHPVAVKKDYLKYVRKASVTSSLETEAGLGNGSLVGCPNLVPSVSPSYIVQNCQEELTPPSSANLSPGSFATQPQFSTMAPESIRAIQVYILDPISKDPDLYEFQEICATAKDKIERGRIRCLRDLEKFFVNMANKTMSSTVSSGAFFDAFLSAIQDSWPHVLEFDRVRQTDAPYSEGYFLDTRHQHGIQSGKPLQQENTQQRASKRRLSIGADELPAPKRLMNNATTFDLQQGAFIKPTTHPRQNTPSKHQLEIQTQAPFSICTPVAPLYNHPQQNLMALKPTFTFDENTKVMVAKGQFHNVQTYHDVETQMLQDQASPFVLPSLVVRQHGGYWPPTPVSAAAAAPSIGFSMSPTTPTSAATATSALKFPGSLPRANTREEATAYLCELCSKSFPRPCDLTKHRKTHDRPFKCDFTSCKYHIDGFPTNKECERHQNDIHAPDSKEWKCEFAPCTYKSKRESNCKQHMEKAHQYVYKRMKRNPRRRDQGVPIAQASKRRKNTSPISQSQPITPLIASSTRPNEGSEIIQAPQQQNLFSQPFNSYFPPLSLDLLDPSQMEVIRGSTFPGSVSPHMSQPIYESSPDFERSPLTIASTGFDDHAALHIHQNASPLFTGDDWALQSETDGHYSVNQFFPSNDNLCILPSQQNPASFPHGLELGEDIQWNPESDTPD